MCERCEEAMEIAEKMLQIVRAEAEGKKALAETAPQQKDKTA